MKALEVAGEFGLDRLIVVDREDAALGATDVRVQMKAVSLNYRDLLMVQGAYNPRQPLPLIPGSDGVGEVVEIGPDVTRFKVGDRVCPIFAQAWQSGEPDKSKLKTTLGGPIDGTLCERPVFDQDGLVAAPTHLTDIQAATLTCAGVTAWSALVTQGGIKPGDTVLVQGTGGVSMFALQIALMSGARVIQTSSSDEKLQKVRELGAHETINYRTTPKWAKEVKALTDKRGVDFVVEVGGAGTLGQSLRAVRIGGTVCVIGVLSGGSQELSVIPILMQNIRVQGVIVGHRESFEAMVRAFEQHEIEPIVSHTFEGLDQTKAAFELMQAAGHFGKIVVTI